MLALANSADFGDTAVTELPGVGARKGGEAGDEEAGCSETRDWVVFSSPVRRISIVLSMQVLYYFVGAWVIRSLSDALPTKEFTQFNE